MGIIEDVQTDTGCKFALAIVLSFILLFVLIIGGILWQLSKLGGMP